MPSSGDRESRRAVAHSSGHQQPMSTNEREGLGALPFCSMHGQIRFHSGESISICMQASSRIAPRMQQKVAFPLFKFQTGGRRVYPLRRPPHHRMDRPGPGCAGHRAGVMGVPIAGGPNGHAGITTERLCEKTCSGLPRNPFRFWPWALHVQTCGDPDTPPSKSFLAFCSSLPAGAAPRPQHDHTARPSWRGPARPGTPVSRAQRANRARAPRPARHAIFQTAQTRACRWIGAAA
jgi:hypothetical protein